MEITEAIVGIVKLAMEARYFVRLEIMIATIPKLFTWLCAISGVAMALVMFILLPLSIPRVTRRFVVASMDVLSYVFGILLWVFGLDLTYSIWGTVGLYVGTGLLFVGMIPVAMIATLYHGDWLLLSGLILLGSAVYGGLWFSTKMDNTLLERL